ncbi:MAG: molybdate ABC transporter substrate-binding protein [Acidimicrobiales bacterium]|nr:molybdate ABC transporter substrate-binding protein [Acidimicrobiales bacterium]
MNRRHAPPRVTRLVLGLLVAVLASCGAAEQSDAQPDTTITVAAASDLRFAFEDLGASFTDETGTEVTFSFGSSGLLREQIINGAPFDLFASANVEFVDAVIDAGRGQADTKATYAYGRLALWAPPGTPLPDAIEDLTDPRYSRIAIANPDHAPYGLAAEAALATSGILDDLRDRLVYGENISDTFRIAQSGNASVGIIALSLVIADGSDHTLVPDDLHDPLRQALVVTSTGEQGDAARAFAAYLDTPAGRETMASYGFVVPDDPEPDR